MIRRRLLTILFICILLPVIITLVESTRAIISQKNAMTEISSNYVKNLSNYAAARWNDGNAERITSFLSLIADYGYDRLISIGRANDDADGKIRAKSKNMKEKFIPGLVAYVADDGKLISCSQNAAVLVNIFARSSLTTLNGGVSREGNVISKFRVGGDDITYVAHVAQTRDPRVYAVAAVTMLSWMGVNDFNIIKLASAGSLSMIMCLLGLLLLRSSVILPLQRLSSQVETLQWGREIPSDINKPVATMQVEEISSLKKAIMDLARRMIEKEELEKRYMRDILKAEEDERGRIAQDIHDGPIQVVSALIQRIQIACLASSEMDNDVRSQLVTAESVAQDLVEDLRDICDSLVPPWVSLGIVSCMEESANRFERQHSVRINLNMDQALDLPLDQTLALFRIFQEAVSNSVRHGKATEVEVDVSRGDNGRKVKFSMADNGRGFSLSDGMMAKLQMEGKRGLNGMRQRIELLGGEFNLVSSPEEGTRITIAV